jgi:hypothetical protein
MHSFVWYEDETPYHKVSCVGQREKAGPHQGPNPLLSLLFLI